MIPSKIMGECAELFIRKRYGFCDKEGGKKMRKNVVILPAYHMIN